MISNGTVWLSGWGITVLRLVAGIIFCVHGAQKLFIFGFGGVSQTFEQLGIPLAPLAAIIVTLVEFFGGAALILGLFTRLVGVLLAVDMLTATLVAHLPAGFFISGGGIEFTMLLCASAVAFVLSGPGELALDRVIAARGNPSLARLTR